MPYETGATSGLADLQSRIKTFLLANGWTNPGGGQILANGSVYFETAVGGSYLSITGGQGELAGALVSPSLYAPKLVGSHPGADIPDVNWPATYHLFAHSSPVHFLCVLNYNTENIQWLTAGELNKYGTWGGGQYVGAPFGRGYNGGNPVTIRNWRSSLTSGSVILGSGLGLWLAAGARMSPFNHETNMQLVCDIDGAPGDWLTNMWDTSASSDNALAFDGARMTADIRGRGPNTFNGQMVLDPVKVNIGRPDTKRSLIGDPVHVRYANILNYEPGDIVTIGADRWMVFPLLRKVVAATPKLIDEVGAVVGWQSEHIGFAVAYDGP